MQVTSLLQQICVGRALQLQSASTFKKQRLACTAISELDESLAAEVITRKVVKEAAAGGYVCSS